MSQLSGRLCHTAVSLSLSLSLSLTHTHTHTPPHCWGVFTQKAGREAQPRQMSSFSRRPLASTSPTCVCMGTSPSAGNTLPWLPDAANRTPETHSRSHHLLEASRGTPVPPAPPRWMRCLLQPLWSLTCGPCHRGGPEGRVTPCTALSLASGMWLAAQRELSLSAPLVRRLTSPVCSLARALLPQRMPREGDAKGRGVG